MICSHLVNLSLLLGAVLSWGVMWPLISELKGDWYPNTLPESSMRSLQGYKVFQNAKKEKEKKKEKNLIHMLIWKCITQVTCFLHTSSLFVLATGFHLYSTYPRRRSLQLLQNLLFIHKEHASKIQMQIPQNR